MNELAAAKAEACQPGWIAQWRERLRVGWRLAAIISTTLIYWGLLNLDALIPRGRKPFEIANIWASRWARVFFRIFGVRLDASGPHLGAGRLYPGGGEQGIGRIFVCNHSSSIDIPIAYRYLSAHAISRHDVAGWPLIGRVSKRLGTLYVDRQSRRSGAEVLKEVDATLAAGEGVVMFPEGTSFKGDEVRTFRPGAFKAAERAGAEMVPIGIAYEDDDACYYHELFTTHLKRIAKRRRLRVAIVAGEPIAFEGRSPVEMKELLHQHVQQLTHAARANLGG